MNRKPFHTTCHVCGKPFRPTTHILRILGHPLCSKGCARSAMDAAVAERKAAQ